jgi:chemotaxis protein methyltransferase CheR
VAALGGGLMPSPDTEFFRSLIVRLLGLQFSDDKLDFLRDVLRQRVLESRQDSATAYLQRLESGGLGREELGRLAEALTVTETFFFRNQDHFMALADLALPARIRARRGEQRLRILSAACASGEEAYTLAMLLEDKFPELQSWDVRLTGVDINPAMLAKATRGLYTPWSLRDTPAEARERHFTMEGSDFRVRADIRARVAFEARNLAEPNPDLWQPNSYDIIFCRNMIMYLAPDVAADLVGRMAKALAPGGFLFLGYAETLRGLSQDFQLCHTHNTFYYQRLEEGQRQPLASGWTQAARSPAHATLAPAWDPSLTWMDAIQQASERIAGLAERAGKVPVAAAAGSPVKQAAPAWSLAPALDLLRGERFAEALEALQGLPEDSDMDADVLLLRAVLLTNLGRMADAEAASRRLLRQSDLNAGAHYVLALCREQAGDLAAAEDEDRTAVYLDAAFAMPCLHLGLLARRAGDSARARRHLEAALGLLAREDASRVLLFGGGFGREGLIQLCRNSLVSLEAAS